MIVNTSKELIEKLFLYGAIAVTIHLVYSYDEHIAWLYALSLLLGYALVRPDRVRHVTDFFQQVTKSGI